MGTPVKMDGTCAVKLHASGGMMPLVGLGTFKRESTIDDLKQAIHMALEAGYRHIDTAYLYRNESIIGDVLQDWFERGRIRREEIFITTKLPPIGTKAEKVEQFIKLSLQKLKLDYVDLYLIHFPVGLIGKDEEDLYPVDENGQAVMDSATDHVAIWKAMEEQVDAGRCKAIGLSNFNSVQIERIVQSARIKPANLQIELHAYLQQHSLRDLCMKHDISVCAYAPLGSKGRTDFNIKPNVQAPVVPLVLEDPLVLKIAQAHAKTPAQILLRHLVQQNVIVVPKSVSQNRIKENLNIFDFVLTDREMNQLNKLDRNVRTFTFDSNFIPIGATCRIPIPHSILRKK